MVKRYHTLLENTLLVLGLVTFCDFALLHPDPPQNPT